MTDYDLGTHMHVFAAWAAASASSVKGARFRVETGRAWLEEAGFTPAKTMDSLPGTNDFDAAHKEWRMHLIEAAKISGAQITHGFAAKLINVYCKARYVREESLESSKAAHLHPPIDKLLLDALGRPECDLGGHGAFWRRMSRTGWSKLQSDQYELIIDRIRDGLGGRPLWTIEEYWRGHQ